MPHYFPSLPEHFIASLQTTVIAATPLPHSPSRAQPTSPFRFPSMPCTLHSPPPKSAFATQRRVPSKEAFILAPSPPHQFERLSIPRTTPSPHYSFHPSPHATQSALFPPRGLFLVLSRTHHPALRVSRPVLNPRILLADSVSLPLTEIPSSAQRTSPFWPSPPQFSPSAPLPVVVAELGRRSIARLLHGSRAVKPSPKMSSWMPRESMRSVPNSLRGL